MNVYKLVHEILGDIAGMKDHLPYVKALRAVTDDLGLSHLKLIPKKLTDEGAEILVKYKTEEDEALLLDAFKDLGWVVQDDYSGSLSDMRNFIVIVPEGVI